MHFLTDAQFYKHQTTLGVGGAVKRIPSCSLLSGLRRVRLRRSHPSFAIVVVQHAAKEYRALDERVLCYTRV